MITPPSIALFINGVYESVLAEILRAQAQGSGESFLQPRSKSVIAILKHNPPTANFPMTLYISTTNDLSHICYLAEIVQWEDKRSLSDQRRQDVSSHLEKCQPNESELFHGTEASKANAVNLLTVRGLRSLAIRPSTSLLDKAKDRSPLKQRKLAGGWIPVYENREVAGFVACSIQTKEVYERNLSKDIENARSLDAAILHRRLATAPKLPERIQIICTGYKRNPHVIVAVLSRAEGVCERCKRKAPFSRKFDGTPFLEVHHRKPLAEGGEDTIDNALALCPNCHREVHHG